MIYLLKNKPNYKNRPRNILIVFIFLLLSFFAFVFPVTMKTVFQTLAKPVWSVSDSAKNNLKNVFDFFNLQSNLVATNKDLRNQIDALNLKVIDYDATTKENEDLKSMLGRPAADVAGSSGSVSGEARQKNRILARVLSSPPQSPYDSLVIDVGSSDGINLGGKVYLSDNVIIGTITSVTPRASLVELFSTGDKKTESVLERTGASYELVGKGGANFSVEAPKDADILWGDSFVYPGLSSATIGSVYYIDTNPQSSFKTIFIRIPGNVFQTKWVFVAPVPTLPSR